MTPYLVGALGAAVGVIAALWFRWKYARLKGKHNLLVERHDNLTAAFRQLEEKSVDAVKRLENERNGLIEQRNEAQEKLRKLRADRGDPGSILDDANRLFPEK